MKDLQWLEEKENLKKKKDLKNKLKAALFTVLLFVGIFIVLYVLSEYTKESLIVLIVAMAIGLVYSVWNLIYQEMRETE